MLGFVGLQNQEIRYTLPSKFIHCRIYLITKPVLTYYTESATCMRLIGASLDSQEGGGVVGANRMIARACHKVVAFRFDPFSFLSRGISAGLRPIFRPIDHTT